MRKGFSPIPNRIVYELMDKLKEAMLDKLPEELQHKEYGRGVVAKVETGNLWRNVNLNGAPSPNRSFS